jgi:hypothetical protein
MAENTHIPVHEVLTSKERTNYPLEHDEYEVPVRGRLGPNKSQASAWLQNYGVIRVDDAANQDVWIEIQLPEQYILEQAARVQQKSAEREKRRKIYEQLTAEFE